MSIVCKRNHYGRRRVDLAGGDGGGSNRVDDRQRRVSGSRRIASCGLLQPRPVWPKRRVFLLHHDRRGRLLQRQQRQLQTMHYRSGLREGHGHQGGGVCRMPHVRLWRCRQSLRDAVLHALAALALKNVDDVQFANASGRTSTRRRCRTRCGGESIPLSAWVCAQLSRAVPNAGAPQIHADRPRRALRSRLAGVVSITEERSSHTEVAEIHARTWRVVARRDAEG